VAESAADGWAVGDRVLLHPILCDRDDPAFASGAVHRSDSTEVLGVVSRNGAYAEEVVVEDYMLRRLDPGLGYEAAALVEPVAVAVRTLVEAGLAAGERVLVLGAGNIGQLVVQAAKALGAGHVAVTDVQADRLELAAAHGADETLDARQPLDGTARRFDVVVDGVATEASVRDAIAACGRGGRVVVYGVPGGDVSFPLREAFVHDVRLITSRLYGADFTLAQRLVSEGRVQPQAIITDRIALADGPGLIGRVLAGAAAPIKVMMQP
jgi:2-desacetyl-2-hydroxyethyl bacteriochlorophyllide A dehydrogenase